MLPSFPALAAFLQQMLGLRPSWSAHKAEFDPAEQLLRTDPRHAGPNACPVCGAVAARHRALATYPELPRDERARGTPQPHAAGGLCRADEELLWADRPRFNRRLRGYLGWYNRERPHRNLGLCTSSRP